WLFGGFAEFVISNLADSDHSWACLENRRHRRPSAGNYPVSGGGDWLSVPALIHNKSALATLVEQDFRGLLAVSTLCTVECRLVGWAAGISVLVRANTSIAYPGLGLDFRVFGVRDLLRNMRVVDHQDARYFRLGDGSSTGRNQKTKRKCQPDWLAASRIVDSSCSLCIDAAARHDKFHLPGSCGYPIPVGG